MTSGRRSRHASDVTRRQLVALLVTALVPATLVFGFGHRGVHAARNVLLPGAGLFERAWVLGVAFTVLAIVATVLWVRWGADWTVVAVLAGSIAMTLIVSPGGHVGVVAHQLTTVRASHEFPLVILALAGWQWFRGLPLVNRLRRRPRVSLAGLDDLARLGPVDRCRTVAVLSLAGPVPSTIASTIGLPDVPRRARRIALVARGRHGRTALDRDHAALRTAEVAIGETAGLEALLADARRQATGVPASEPGWVRLLDGTLAAAVLGDAGHPGPSAQWRRMWGGGFGLRRVHRPAMCWTPLGVAVGRAEAWEHALAAGIAHTSGWIGNEDWPALRARVLGAAARGSQHPQDERLIAAGCSRRTARHGSGPFPSSTASPPSPWRSSWCGSSASSGARGH